MAYLGAHRFIRSAAVLVFLFVALGSALPVVAQQLGLPQSTILTISSDRMYAQSAFGKRVAQEIEAESEVLASENRKIEEELTAEEKDLTTRRAEMDPDKFRELADSFDRKVQDIRLTQDAKTRTLAQKNEQEQVRFRQAARPILERLMREAGAGVVLERSSVVLSTSAIDMTDIAISRLDATLGDGINTDDN